MARANFPLFPRPQHEAQLIGLAPFLGGGESTFTRLREALESYLWFAVPKKKVTRHKKRLKTTVQNRIPLRKDIIIDNRTGEITLRHKLPPNWKDYLPEVKE